MLWTFLFIFFDFVCVVVIFACVVEAVSAIPAEVRTQSEAHYSRPYDLFLLLFFVMGLGIPQIVIFT